MTMAETKTWAEQMTDTMLRLKAQNAADQITIETLKAQGCASPMALALVGCMLAGSWHDVDRQDLLERYGFIEPFIVTQEDLDGEIAQWENSEEPRIGEQWFRQTESGKAAWAEYERQRIEAALDPGH